MRIKVFIIGANERAKVAAEVIKNKYALKMEVVGIQKSAETEKRIYERFLKEFNGNISTEDLQKTEKQINEEKELTMQNAKYLRTAKILLKISIILIPI